MVDIIGPSNSTGTSLLKSAEVRFSSFCALVWAVLANYLNRKTRSFHLNLNSQRVFKNHQYFMVSKSNFGAFLQDKFSLCGITPNHLRFKL